MYIYIYIYYIDACNLLFLLVPVAIAIIMPYLYRVKNELSGVYCGLCILMRMLQIEQEVDVVTTMERLRQQRPGMLRNKVSEFMYCT